MNDGEPRRAMTTLKERVLDVILKTGSLVHLDKEIRLASGEMSRDFIDGKLAVSKAEDLALIGEAMVSVANDAAARFEAVGGLVLGSVPFTFAVAQNAGSAWFLVRKEPKGRGTNRLTEGARLTKGMPVMLVDDVVTTGGSIQLACERVQELGAQVVFASTLVDRGDTAKGYFEKRGIPYTPLLTYRDLDIEPVGHGRGIA